VPSKTANKENDAERRFMKKFESPTDARPHGVDSRSNDRLGRKTSASASAFEKVLRAFETGGFTYANVLARLKLLLAIGASATELSEILRRRELVEHLPEHAHAEILNILNEAMARAAAAAAAAEAAAGEAEGVKTDAATESVPTPDAATETAESIATTALRDAVLPEPAPPKDDAAHRSAGAPAPSPVLAAGGAQGVAPGGGPVTALMAERLHMLEVRIAGKNADFEALNRSYERNRDAERAAVARVTALTAELSAVRAARESEQAKIREIDGLSAEREAVAEAERIRSEEILREAAQYQIESRGLRESLAERDATLAELQQETARMAGALVAHEKAGAQLEQALLAARSRGDAIALELKASQEAAAALNAQLDSSAAHLNAVRRELEAVESQSQSYLDALRSREWRRGFDQNLVHEADSRLDAAHVEGGALQAQQRQLQAEVASLQAEVAGLKAEVQRRDAEHAMNLGQVPAQHAAPPAEAAPRPLEADQPTAAPVVPKPPAPRPAGGGKSGATARWIGGLGITVCVVAGFAWAFAHRPPPPAPPPPPPAPVAALPRPGTVLRDCAACPGMTVLPTGRFKQGSASNDSGSSAFEKPQHWVSVGRTIAMATNAVTVDDFRQFVAATARDMRGCDIYDDGWKHRPTSSWKEPGFTQAGTHPVTCVSWDDAVAYAQWLSVKSGHRYRLPSASEWEYAARAGGEAAPWNAGGSDACANANVADQSAARRYPGWNVFACNDSYVYTAPVGSFKANSYGLNDLLGNVFQWTQDCWNTDYDGAPIDGSARTDGNCAEHELRGGSWFSSPAYVRANYRNHFAADYRTSSVGIRLVREVAP
jgi:formylglycine-generating enzyme required for sulfatase activity